MKAEMSALSQMLTPSRSLVVTFSANGTVKVERFVRQTDGSYTADKRDSFQVRSDSKQDTVYFEFGLDPTSDSSALFVEMVGDWLDYIWDDDVAGILGGKEKFPFGSGPLGITDTSAPKVPRVRVRKGVFTNLDVDSESTPPASRLTIHGVRKTSVCDVSAVPTKVLSLWLPDDSVLGSVKLFPWPVDGGVLTYQSVDKKTPKAKVK